MQNYWQKQTAEKPLFPDLLWSRPENKNQAGKLLIVGGNVHGFAAAGEAYAEATRAGIGTARVLLPDSLQKTVGKVFEAGEYAPSSASGSFGQPALAEMLAMASWADATLLAGDFGRNSETAILLEKFANKYQGLLAITQDALDYFTKSDQILRRENTLLVLSFAQLQKVAKNANFPIAFTHEMDFLRLVEALHQFTIKYSTTIFVKRDDTYYVATSGRVITMLIKSSEKIWRVKHAATATVWWLQNPTKTFESISTSLVTD
jgi:ADP-dependent NAD(P)H-hydrate dehydratase / NAD(P)H-hydrate epimerase